MSQEVWLAKLADLNVYRARHGEAPHKPLLLLVLLELAERGELNSNTLRLTPELSFRFNTLWPIVAYRRTQQPDIRMPFHRLSRDGLWVPYTPDGALSPDQKLTSYVRLNDDFFRHTRDTEFRRRARRILIARWFNPAERNALYATFGMPVPSDDEVARDARFELPEDAIRTGREARFRFEVVPAYNYTCALTGYRISTIDKGSIVDAAHIHEFSDSRNNDPKNGMALCKNAHWMFDVGLWSVADDYRIVVAQDAFSEDSPDQKPLSEYHGSPLRLPKDAALWPDPRHLAWHRKHKFLGAA